MPCLVHRYIKLPQSSAGGKVSSSGAMAAPRLPQRGRKKELPPWCDFTACPAGLSPKCQSSFFKRFFCWTGSKKLSDTEELSVRFSASSSRVSVCRKNCYSERKHCRHMQTSGDASPLRRLGSMCPKVDCASHSPWLSSLCRAGEDGWAMLSSVPDRSPAWTAIAQ